MAELSSFQLEHVERFRPEVAVLLNLTEDHLDRHGDFAALRRRQAAHLREPDAPTTWRCSTLDDPPTAGLTVPGSPRTGYFSLGGEGDDLVAGLGYGRVGTLRAPAWRGLLWVLAGETRGPLCRASELALRGEHNLPTRWRRPRRRLRRRRAAGELAQPRCATFEGVPHRLQVAGVAGGVT